MGPGVVRTTVVVAWVVVVSVTTEGIGVGVGATELLEV